MAGAAAPDRVRRPARARLLSVIAAAAATVLSPSLAHAQLSPALLAEALDDVGRRDADLRTFYAARGHRSLWVQGERLNDAAETMYRLASTAQLDGLSRKALQADKLATVLRRADRGDPDDLAHAELALSRTLAAYVQGTRIPRQAGMSYQNSLLAPVVPTAGAALAAAAAAPSLDRYLAELQWMHPIYTDLRAALAERELDRDQAQVVQLNLERARALPADPAPRYVLIDAAGAQLYMYENGRVVDTMKVVVGKPTQQTPMIAGMLSTAVLNPYWNVPTDLARDRIAFNVLKKGQGYLKADGYQVLSDFSDNPKVLNAAKVDWNAVAAGTREIRVRQLPGKANFMGKMKFMFPNNQGIYLHDTPDKALLKDDIRQASSGCVRLEDASRLARWLFGRTLTPNPKLVEQNVQLPQPVPLYITYLTAAPVNGELVFRDDNYSRDLIQLATLRAATRRAR